MEIKIKKLSDKAVVPKKAHKTDACFDVVATSKTDLGDGRIEYGLGFSLQIGDSPYKNYNETIQFDFRARSSVHKKGMILSNGIGTGDLGYTGEYKLVFYKIIPTLPDYEVGERIGQMQVRSSHNIDFIEVGELEETDRGAGGYGSTGSN